MSQANSASTDCKISCVIPFRNASRTIITSLKALEESSLPPDEVICVDDASTDDTCNKIRVFTHESSLRIYCIAPSLVQRGAAATRNSGSQEAKGEYILFMDADVVVERNTIERLQCHLKEQQVSAVVALYRDYSYGPGILAHFQAYMVNTIYTKLDPLHCPCLGTQCVLMKKSIFHANDGFDESYTSATVEDFEFGYRLQAQGMHIGIATDAHIVHNHIYTAKTFSRNYYTKARDLAILLLTNPHVTLSSTGYYDRSNLPILLLFLLDIFSLIAGAVFSLQLLWVLPVSFFVHILIWNSFIRQAAQRWGWKTAICFVFLRTIVVVIGWIGVTTGLLQVACKKITDFRGQYKSGIRNC